MKTSVFSKRVLSTVALFLFIVTVISLVPMSAVYSYAEQAKQTAAKAANEDTALPVLYLTTDDGEVVTSRDEYKHANLKIELNDIYADCENRYTTEEGAGLNIRCRGNSTYNFGNMHTVKKYSYRIKLDKKADMFGMGENKHWILLNNYFEPTFLRNKAGYELSRALGLAYCDSTWVVLYLNGEYRGLYQFCESVRVNKNRLDIFDWDNTIEDVAEAIGRGNGLSEDQVDELTDRMEKNLSWVTSGKFENYKISDYYDTSKLDIHSGYLIEYDSFDNKTDTRPHLFPSGTTPKGVELKIDAPEYAYTNDAMITFVRNLITDFEEAVYSETFYNSKGKHYSEYVDMDSMVNFWLQQVLCANGEFGIRSMFFHIQNGKIVWSPVWDLDCGGGNHITVTTDPTKWNGMGKERNHWYREVQGDPYFVSLLQEKYATLSEVVDDYYASIPLYYEYIKKESERDFAKYGPVHGWNNKNKYPVEVEYEEYYNYTAARLAWVDKTLQTKDLNIAGYGMSKSTKINTSLFYKGSNKPLPTDKITVHGVAGDFLYDPTTGSGLTLRFSTQHTTLTKFDMFINGSLVGTYKADNKQEFYEFDIPLINVDLREGALNTVYLACYNASSIYNKTSFTFRVSSVTNPTENECIVWLGDYYTKVAKGSEIFAPNAVGYSVDGLDIVGITDGENTYKFGDKIKVEKNLFLYPVWEREHFLDVLTLEDTESNRYSFKSTDGWVSRHGEEVPYSEPMTMSGSGLVGVQEKYGKAGIVTVRLVGIAAKDNERVGFEVTNAGQKKEYVTNIAYNTLYSKENSFITDSGVFYTAEVDVSTKGEYTLTVTAFAEKNNARTTLGNYEVTYREGNFVSAVRIDG